MCAIRRFVRSRWTNASGPIDIASNCVGLFSGIMATVLDCSDEETWDFSFPQRQVDARTIRTFLLPGSGARAGSIVTSPPPPACFQRLRPIATISGAPTEPQRVSALAGARSPVAFITGLRLLTFTVCLAALIVDFGGL